MRDIKTEITSGSATITMSKHDLVDERSTGFGTEYQFDDSSAHGLKKYVGHSNADIYISHDHYHLFNDPELHIHCSKPLSTNTSADEIIITCSVC